MVSPVEPWTYLLESTRFDRAHRVLKMPKVTFVTDKITVEVPVGAAIPDIVDQCGATLPFGCRMGSCGTCRCIIEEGLENLNSLTQEENALFENLTSVGATERLGCQLKIMGDVKIRS